MTMAETQIEDQRAARHALLRERLPEHIERLGWDADRIRLHQTDRLRSLLARAADGSPFHAERLAGVDADRFELDDLPRLPVMTKREMMDRFDDVVTDRRLTRPLVEAHLGATGSDAEELLGEYLVLASGGSSGERGVFVYERTDATDFLLALVRPGVARMLAVFGEIPDGGVPLAVIAAGSGVHATRAFASLFGGDLMVPTSIPVTTPMPEIVSRLNDLQPVLLQGYPFAIHRLAEEKLAGRLSISPLGVTSTSEPLSSEARDRIDEAFSVGVSDMFGSSEGVLGVSPPDDAGIVLANDLAIIELVDDDYQPVPAGTPSSRVLVTSLLSATQPLIRYELTDRFVRLPDAEEHGHWRVAVEGRADDAFVYGDVTVHPLAIRSMLVKMPTVVEYQVRQTVDGVVVDVVAPRGIDEDDVRSRLALGLASAGLVGASVDVRVIDSVPKHERTGKVRRFVPLA